MKSYTDIEQSKKLAEFLPTESADMHYFVANSLEKQEINYAIRCGTPIVKTDIPCWSIAALLNILPYPSLNKTSSGWRCDCYNEEGIIVKMGETTDNSVDTCYQLILTLHELKIL